MKSLISSCLGFSKIASLSSSDAILIILALLVLVGVVLLGIVLLAVFIKFRKPIRNNCGHTGSGYGLNKRKSIGINRGETFELLPNEPCNAQPSGGCLAPNETESSIAWKLVSARWILAKYLKRAENEQFDVCSLCPFGYDKLLFAAGLEGLRAFSLKDAQLSPHDPCQLKPVYKIAFEAPDTLVLLLGERDGKPTVNWLASLRRDEWWSDKWSEKYRTQLKLPPNSIANDMLIYGSLVLIGCCNGEKLYAYEVTAEDDLHEDSPFLCKKIFRFAVTKLNGDTLVALSHNRSVSLNRLKDEFLSL